MTIEQRARAKHINAVAKDFMCAMITNSSYYDIHTKDFGKTIKMSFEMAKEFVDSEQKTK